MHAYGAEGPWIEICTGPKISCYVCCAPGQGTLLSFASLHQGELNGYWPIGWGNNRLVVPWISDPLSNIE